jgi:hypothetical protein
MDYGFPTDVIEALNRDVPKFGELVDILKPGVTSLSNASKRFASWCSYLPLDHISLSFMLTKNAGFIETSLKRHFRESNAHLFDKGYPMREFVPNTPSTNRESIESFVNDMVKENQCFDIDCAYSVDQSLMDRLSDVGVDSFGPHKFARIAKFGRRTIGQSHPSCLIIWTLKHKFIERSQVKKIMRHWKRSTENNRLTLRSDLVLFSIDDFLASPNDIQLQFIHKDSSLTCILTRLVWKDFNHLYGMIAEPIDGDACMTTYNTVENRTTLLSIGLMKEGSRMNSSLARLLAFLCWKRDMVEERLRIADLNREREARSKRRRRIM